MPRLLTTDRWWATLGDVDDTTDVETVARYGRAHPATYAGLWFDGDRLQVGFTAQAGLHETRLRPLLTWPDRVDVVTARWTIAARDRVRAQAKRAVAVHPGMLRSSGGRDHHRVHLGLRADGGRGPARALRCEGLGHGGR